MNDWGNACLGKPLRADRRRSRRPEADFSGKVLRMQRLVRELGTGMERHHAVSATPRRVHPSVYCPFSRTGKDGPEVMSNERNLRMILSHAYQRHRHSVRCRGWAGQQR